EAMSRILKAVDVLQNGRKLQQIRGLELAQRGVGLEYEQRVLRVPFVQRRNERHIQGGIVGHGMATAARTPIAAEGLAKEDVRARADILGDEPGDHPRVLRAGVESIFDAQRLWRVRRV